MILIAAMGNNRVIGSGSGMPWSVPDEYAQYLQFIDGQTVIMGRRSWEIFGADMTRSNNLVVSRSASIPGVEVCASLEAAIARGRELGGELGGELFCAGGASLYAQALPLADRMYLSFIKGEYSGDAFFPAFNESDWNIDEDRDHERFRFVAYSRRVGHNTAP